MEAHTPNTPQEAGKDKPKLIPQMNKGVITKMAMPKTMMAQQMTTGNPNITQQMSKGKPPIPQLMPRMTPPSIGLGISKMSPQMKDISKMSPHVTKDKPKLIPINIDRLKTPHQMNMDTSKIADQMAMNLSKMAPHMTMDISKMTQRMRDMSKKTVQLSKDKLQMAHSTNVDKSKEQEKTFEMDMVGRYLIPFFSLI